MSNKNKVLSFLLGFVCLLSVVIFIGLVQINGVLVAKHRFPLFACLIVIAFVLFVLLRKNNKKIFIAIIALVYSLLLLLASFYIYKTYAAFHRVADQEEEAIDPDDAKKDLERQGIKISGDLQIDNAVENKPVGADGSFTVYFSGIDRAGKISGVSRTDVNLIACVNPKTGKMLITTLPRDSYVKIAGGGHDQYDKLTHSGIYGVASSVKTLENLFGIDINYYFRVNFTSLERIVDVLGGIDVENPVTFQANGKTFAQGTIHLNGKDALTFSRERHHLADGDRDRGRNHQRVLIAILKKAMSPSILLNYPSLMDTLGDATQTNMPVDKMTELINEQLEKGTKWTYDTAEVSGTGSTGKLPSYAMPGWKLYMYRLNEESVRANASKMKEVLGIGK